MKIIIVVLLSMILGAATMFPIAYNRGFHQSMEQF